MGTYPAEVGYREKTDVLGQVAHTSHRALMDGSESHSTKQLDEPVFGATISYRIESCEKRVASLYLGTDARFTRSVDARPTTLKACREAPGPVITDFSIQKLLGKKFCFPTTEGAFYFAVEAHGEPNSNGAPAIAFTGVEYISP
ncbi:hypothetical protein ACIO87_33430 [Streptomyces sp. NPDC087218]|uniref:hypothetical protein n=1 Tax=Streptomyces sp. NPDC087218 TaxID=3365769 RepID=UPI0037F86487